MTLGGLEQAECDLRNLHYQSLGEGVPKVTDTVARAIADVPGTGSHASNALKRAGWEGKTPIASILITVNNSRMAGSRWIFTGSLGKLDIPTIVSPL